MKLWAAAKINLFLNVLEKRADGYHNIETVYQSVGLTDELTFEPTASETTLECDDPSVPVDSRNLVVGAIEVLRRRYPERVKGLRVALKKRIPVGGGLGGGSADAAATLRACNTLFELGLSAEELRALGEELGMDVPFLVEGGRAIGTGRGERLEALEVREEFWVAIVLPRLSISTRWAYEALDGVPPRESPSLDAFVRRMRDESVASWSHHTYNSFEQVVFPAHPELREIRDRLLQLGCAGALLTGSGAALVGLAGDRERAKGIGEKISGGGLRTAVVPILGSGSEAAVDDPGFV